MPDFVRRKLSNSKSLGEILKAARKKKDITLSEAEEETKVRVKYLEALEEGRFDILPSNVYALGFLTKYADLLELNKEEISTQFKLERGENNSFSSLAPGRHLKEFKFSVTPKIMAVIFVTLVLLLILGYIVYSVRSFTSPPNLVISSPSAEQILKEDTVEIVGKTDEGVTLTINNQAVSVGSNGNFSQQVKLNPGLNTFEIRTTNRLKKETVKLVKILAEY